MDEHAPRHGVNDVAPSDSHTHNYGEHTMLFSVTLPHPWRRTPPLVFLLATLATTASLHAQGEVTAQGRMEDGKIMLPPEQRKQLMAALGQQMGMKPRPKTGRTVVEALRASKQYSTFLAIAERGGMLPLLEGKSVDSSTPAITLVQDSVKLPNVSSSNIQIQTNGAAPGINETEIKSSVMDMLQDAMGDVILGVVAEEGKITVFAPTDAAFAKLSKASLDSLKTDSVAAKAFVRAYVVNRGMYRDGFGKIKNAATLSGDTITIAVKSPAPTINDVAIAEADVAADNGVVHGLATLLPPRRRP
jgi:uncharacterized surface protein with fasciclin (FAS1) repeats